MIVQPASTNPAGPVRRGLRVVGLVVPVVLLAGVVGAGLLGPRQDAAPPAATTRPADAPSGAPGPAASDGPAASAGPAATFVGGDPAFPGAVANLPVLTVSDAVEAHVAGHAPAVVAIAGYLVAWVDPQTCARPVAGFPGDGCQREAVLGQYSWATPGSDGFYGIGPHLHAIVPPGVAVPDTAVGLITYGSDPPPPVVVIGRFGATDAGCRSDFTGCEQPFTIERVTWVSGQRVALGREVATGVTTTADDPMVLDPATTAGRALGPVTTLLRIALVARETVPILDPAAATSGAAGTPGPAVPVGGGRGPVWYVRGLDVPYDPLPDPPYGRLAPVIRWAVLDPRSGAVIASGETPSQPSPDGGPMVRS